MSADSSRVIEPIASDAAAASPPKPTQHAEYSSTWEQSCDKIKRIAEILIQPLTTTKGLKAINKVIRNISSIIAQLDIEPSLHPGVADFLNFSAAAKGVLGSLGLIFSIPKLIDLAKKRSDAFSTVNDAAKSLSTLSDLVPDTIGIVNFFDRYKFYDLGKASFPLSIVSSVFDIASTIFSAIHKWHTIYATSENAPKLETKILKWTNRKKDPNLWKAKSEEDTDQLITRYCKKEIIKERMSLLKRLIPILEEKCKALKAEYESDKDNEDKSKQQRYESLNAYLYAIPKEGSHDPEGLVGILKSLEEKFSTYLQDKKKSIEVADGDFVGKDRLMEILRAIPDNEEMVDNIGEILTESHAEEEYWSRLRQQGAEVDKAFESYSNNMLIYWKQEKQYNENENTLAKTALVFMLATLTLAVISLILQVVPQGSSYRFIAKHVTWVTTALSLAASLGGIGRLFFEEQIKMERPRKPRIFAKKLVAS